MDPAGTIESRESSKKEILDRVGEYAERYTTRINREVGKDRIPYSGSVLTKAEIQVMVESVLTGWFGADKKVNEFEKELAQLHERKHALMVNSGSSANLVALTALCSNQIGNQRLRSGDEVITPATTFPTTLNPIFQNRLTPVFIDTDLHTLNLDVTQLDAALSDKTRALVVPHILGNPANMRVINEFVQENNLLIVEDICDALFSKYDGKLVGTFGDMATLSFYPAHHITTGEGGCILMDDSNLERISRSIRDWGRACWCSTAENHPMGACRKRFDYKVGNIPYDHKYIYSNMGYNLKPLDLQGAIGLVQLKRLDDFRNARRRNYQRLAGILSPHDGDDIRIIRATENSDPNWFAFPFALIGNKSEDTQAFVRHLEKNLITTRRMFGGNILRHEAYLNMDYPYRVVGDLSNADEILKSTVFVGVYPGLSEQEIDYMGEKIIEFLESN